MAIEIKVPSAGESVTEAIVAKIIKESGSYVKKDEEVLELETDKVNQTIHAPASGVLHLNVKVDDTVQVDQLIGTIDPEKPPSSMPDAISTKREKLGEDAISSPPASPSFPNSEGARRFPQSYVASLDRENQPPPTAAAQETPHTAHPTAAQKKEHIPLPSLKQEGSQVRKRMSGLRRTIAKRLVDGKNSTATLTTFNEVDMSAVMEIRKREQEAFLKKHGVKLGFMSFFLKACVAALKEFPIVHAFIDGEELVYNHSYHIGISVSTDQGLMVPVIKQSDQLSFATVENAIRDYAEKARMGTISIDDLKGGSFTITNGGVFGSMLSTPILNPPQSAILGMHNIVKRAVIIDDQIVVRPIMYLALSYDHRIIDGKEAVSFLSKVKELLEKPDRLLLDF